MENLVEKWKRTRNTPLKTKKRDSARLSYNSKYGSSKKKPIILFSDSSIDEEKYDSG